jgi:peptidoglycan/xylan/chitin deacetylase (PgdA/CDA1 family)
MKRKPICNLKYILKKSEIISLIVFVLIFVLFGGNNLVLSADFEKNDPKIENVPFNKEDSVSIMESSAYFSIVEINIYAPVPILVGCLGMEELHDTIHTRINAKNNAIPVLQISEATMVSEAVPEKTIKTNSDNKASKIAYLTFDDGLDRKVTPQILEILKQYEVKATFFILGNSVSKNKDILKRMVDEGHVIGNHTYTHKKDIIYTDVKNFSDELVRTTNAIYDAVGIKPKLFRPPYGAPYIRSREYKEALSQYKTVLWNVDSMDSRVKGITSSGIAASVKEQLKNKSNATILFHSTSARVETVKALPEIIEFLIDNGYSISILE